MGDPRTEPSMEEILASIKRIIADDGGAPAVAAPRPRGRPVAVPAPRAAPVAEETVLELTDPMQSANAAADPAPAVTPEPEATPMKSESPAAPQPQRAAILVSEDAAATSRSALETLSKLVVTPAEGVDNTLDGLVREMLRPMLKEWLDARLPDLVEGLVAREIARITGRSL